MRRPLLWLVFGASSVAVAGCALVLRPSHAIGDYKDSLINDIRPIRNGTIRVTFLGTSTLLLEDDSTKLLIDGFISRPPLRHVLIRGLRTNTAVVDTVLNRLGARRVDALFTVHSHYDHALDAAYIARTRHALLYGSESTRMVGLGGRVDPGRIKVFVEGEPATVGEFRVTPFRSTHSTQSWPVSFLGQITDPLRQPAHVSQYREGGSFDLLIQHRNHTILIKPSPFLDSLPTGLRADVVFLGIGTLGKRDTNFKHAYYERWVRGVGARHVIPIHWDDFFAPLSDDLPAAPWVVDTKPRAAFDYLIGCTQKDRIGFQILQGFGSILLFSPDGPPTRPPARPPVLHPRCPRG